MKDFIQLIASHQTKRDFTGAKLSPETVKELVKVGQRGATSQNLQNYSIISVTDPEKLKRLEEITGYNYIVSAGHFYIFLVDQYRNEHYLAEKDLKMLKTFDRFLGGVYDSTIVAQNMVLAAESLGLSTVYFGSILSDARKVIEMFHLPKLTFPVFGLALGKTTAPSKPLKPRLPLETMYFENEYPVFETYSEDLKAYDQQILDYYEGLGYPGASNYQDFVAKVGPHSLESRKELLAILKEQGLLTDEKE